MKRWIKFLIAFVIISVGALTIADALLDRSARRAATDNGAYRDFHNVTASEVEQRIRSGLPVGTTRAAVENYLTDQRMRFSFDTSTNEIYALAPYLKGSNFVIRSDMGVQFHFDRTQKLQSIQTKVELTGP